MTRIPFLALLLAANPAAAASDPAAAIRRIAAEAGLPVPTETPPPIVLDSPAFEIYALTSGLGFKTRIWEARQLADFGCAQATYASFADLFRRGSLGLSWFVAQIRALDPSPIRIHLVDRPGGGTAGSFWHLGHLLLFPDPGRIQLYCLDGLAEGSTLLHEMAHLYMYRAYGKNLLPDSSSVPNHADTVLGVTSPANAWVEGFAVLIKNAYDPGDFDFPCGRFGWVCLPGLSSMFPLYTLEAQVRCPEDPACRTDARLRNPMAWRDRPWRGKIANEHFVALMLWSLVQRSGNLAAAGPVPLQYFEPVLEILRRAPREMPRGRHEDLDQFLQHYLRHHPQDKPILQDAARYLAGNTELPDYLR